MSVKFRHTYFLLSLYTSTAQGKSDKERSQGGRCMPEAALCLASRLVDDQVTPVYLNGCCFSVLQLPVHMNGSTESQPHSGSSASSRGLLAAVLGATAIVAFIYLRHLRKVA